MRVLIGTPVHICKDYSMARWLNSVSQVRQKYPADLLMVDNSPGLDYINTIKSHCFKCHVANYQLKRLEVPQGPKIGKSIHEQEHERVTRAREIIRSEFINNNYDACFFWENDILIPPHSLMKLVTLMQTGNFMVVVHNNWIKNVPNQPSFGYDLALFSRECLEKYSFLPEFGSWYEAELWFQKRLDRDKCTYTEVYGLIEPIYHLDK